MSGIAKLVSDSIIEFVNCGCCVIVEHQNRGIRGNDRPYTEGGHGELPKRAKEKRGGGCS